jgi:hypothetical protein
MYRLYGLFPLDGRSVPGNVDGTLLNPVLRSLISEASAWLNFEFYRPGLIPGVRYGRPCGAGGLKSKRGTPCLGPELHGIFQGRRNGKDARVSGEQVNPVDAPFGRHLLSEIPLVAAQIERRARRPVRWILRFGQFALTFRRLVVSNRLVFLNRRARGSSREFGCFDFCV